MADTLDVPLWADTIEEDKELTPESPPVIIKYIFSPLCFGKKKSAGPITPIIPKSVTKILAQPDLFNILCNMCKTFSNSTFEERGDKIILTSFLCSRCVGHIATADKSTWCVNAESSKHPTCMKTRKLNKLGQPFDNLCRACRIALK
uniref:Uncharacterized protein n=1 Tax=Abalone asfa-like virus TaxID=2839893 RepID=A0A5K7Y392_9VIRU|nr:hypothetical protein [Abalone asfa-like virus]BCY04601.1 hypothetical protein [Abalone asfa-like virus]